MPRIWFILGLVWLGGWGTGCEENIPLTIPAGEEKLVVQGYMEQNAPPFVLLSRSLPAFSSSEPATLAALIHGAAVTITQGGRIYALSEVLVRDLPMAQQRIFAEQFGIDLKKLDPESNIPLYVYTTAELKGAPRQQYHLRIETAGQVLTAVTSIPNPSPLDSLWFVPHPNPANDSLVTLWYRYHDPDTLGNNIRYFTRRNREPFYPGYFTSVLTDEFVNGRIINFPLERGWPKSTKVEDETYRYFGRGDTVQVKWAALDYLHYQFWFTLEADRASNGNPFGFPTTIRSNIQGGLGIWGGYGVSKHTVISK